MVPINSINSTHSYSGFLEPSPGKPWVSWKEIAIRTQHEEHDNGYVYTVAVHQEIIKQLNLRTA